MRANPSAQWLNFNARARRARGYALFGLSPVEIRANVKARALRPFRMSVPVDD